MRCRNCNSHSLEILNSIESIEQKVLTSDAQELKNVKATRTLCSNCACIEVHYMPEDRLKTYFREGYNISDTVQDNLIVHRNNSVNKHTYIIDNLSNLLNKLSSRGIFLEIACGRGKLVRFFQDKYPQWKCYGIDPSVESPSNYTKRSNKVTFIRDYFETKYFQGMAFDVVVAHGFLNRSPTLPELLKIRSCCRKGTLLSLEFLVLDNSVFTPYIWDHSFMYMMDVFEVYLKHAGFISIANVDCVSSYHYLCECRADAKPLSGIVIEDNKVKETKKLFYKHIEWWQELKKNYKRSGLSKPDKEYGLFGAGLYNAIFLQLIREQKFAWVVDEVKHGGRFFSLPVIGLREAKDKKNGQVLICARPEYINVIKNKLSNNKISHLVMNP